MKLGTNGDVIGRIIERLKNGWILFYGPIEYYNSTENDFYPPGTKENRNFELCSGGCSGKIVTLALGKKEGKIVKKIGKEKIKNMVAMECVDVLEGAFVSLTVEKKGNNKMSLDDFIERQIYVFFKNLETSIRTGIRPLCLFELPKQSKHKNKPKKQRKHISKSIRHEVFKRDDYKCVECGASNKETRLHIDHIVPVAQGGSDELDNLQTLCEDCNLAKSDRKWKGGLKD